MRTGETALHYVEMRRVIHDEAVRFQRKFLRDMHKGMFSGVVIVFPNLKGNKYVYVDLYEQACARFADGGTMSRELVARDEFVEN